MLLPKHYIYLPSKLKDSGRGCLQIATLHRNEHWLRKVPRQVYSYCCLKTLNRPLLESRLLISKK